MTLRESTLHARRLAREGCNLDALECLAVALRDDYPRLKAGACPFILQAPEAHEYGPISGEEPTRALRPRVPRANVVLPFRRPKGTP
jgi:hypothetical protein